MAFRLLPHRCEVDGGCDNDAVGFFQPTTYRGETIFLWSCAPCRDWWLTRHPDAVFTLHPAPEG